VAPGVENEQGFWATAKRVGVEFVPFLSARVLHAIRPSFAKLSQTYFREEPAHERQ